jgi:hypothetical protein
MGSVDLAIPRLLLQGGTYDIIGSIVDYTCTHTYDSAEQPAHRRPVGTDARIRGVAVLTERGEIWSAKLGRPSPMPDNWGSIES